MLPHAALRRISLASILCLWALSAAAGEGTVELGYVRLTGGGHPVRGAEDGILFAQYLDADCKVVPGGFQSSPGMAGSPLDEIEAQVTLAACRQPAEPRARCSWRIEPRSADASCGSHSASSSGSASWKGWSGSLRIQLPEETGVYEWRLACQLGDGTKRELASPVFVTLAKPLAPFSPPDPEWYARAACWAAGFRAGAEESEVIEAVQRGIYAYGGRSWRYGFAYRHEDGRYVFPLEDKDSGQVSVEYRFKGDEPELRCYEADPAYCKCPWQALVDSGSVCTFADCYVFSDILQAMAGVFGVGGLRPVMIQGEGNRGFITHASQSLDPEFRGNVLVDEPACGSDDRCTTPYYFGTHSLRSRDERFFDATFNGIYDRPDLPIQASRVAGQYRSTLTLVGDRRLVAQGEGYGGWMWFRLADGEPPEPQAAARAPVRFTGNSVFEKSTVTAADPAARRLVGEVEVEILAAGEYVVDALLINGDGETVATRASWLASRPSGALVSGPAGKQVVRLAFSGEEIYRSKLDGPYRVRVAVKDQGRTVAETLLDTPTFRHDEFGQVDGMLRGAEPLTEHGGRAFVVDLEARMKTTLALELRLSSGGRSIAYGGRRDEVFTGRHKLRVDLDDVRRPDTSSSAQLTVILYDEKLTAIDHLVVDLAGNHATLVK